MKYEKPVVTTLAPALKAIEKSAADKNIQHLLDSDNVTRNATPNAYEGDE